MVVVVTKPIVSLFVRTSLQRNVSKIAITEVRTAAQCLWWLNVLIGRVLFLLSVFVFKEPFLCPWTGVQSDLHIPDWFQFSSVMLL